ncbi:MULTISPECIES: FkbM family methyltransferase [Brevundimonas]|uniref:FkbM family methyltransferase n=1 Tax=Brevundimonas sp. ZS04 TaxID=1906854 RepID=UPI0011784A88|nr:MULTISPECIES: FkbM family methyltransferase [Brevundimonas]
MIDSPLHDDLLRCSHKGDARPVVTRDSYERYVHALRIAYRAMSLSPEITNSALNIPPFENFSGDRQEITLMAIAAMRQRLDRVNSGLTAAFLDKPWLKEMTFNGQRVYIPIVNQEGLSWYSDSPMMNFDFLVETFHGMHYGAKVIYDIGGHQGVWALYYSTCIPKTGRVHTFEPSIINIEIAALSFLLNDASNIVIVPAGIGNSNTQIKSNEDGLLISGDSHNINLMKLDSVMLESPDFIKIDIEGYEHELLEEMPDIFDFCQNIHLEIHVPHLVARGIDYRETFMKIPFDRVNVHLSTWGQLTRVGPDDELTNFSTLLITPRT